MSIKTVYPPLIKKGDTIGLVAPAGIWDEELFRQGVGLLADYGFKVKFPRDFAQPEKYLAGSDEYRTEIFHDMWRDPEVSAILAVRGGYGSLRILGRIDYDLIKAHPKPFVGFSDITALHSAIFNQTGLVTFHGPMLTTIGKSSRESIASFFHTLTKGDYLPVNNKSLEILKPGNGSGQLAGGNLTTLNHLLATPYEVSWENKIIFLEDVGEPLYRIDRLLTHLATAGRFKGISGLLLGSFTNCGDVELIWERVLELFHDENLPIWGNCPFGHAQENIMLPFGGEVTITDNELQISNHLATS